ncbi:hypothetical protein ACFQT0_30345 [Hymenobacter humi]|uniref:Uncharacterized protein n=1 Tax=Hymenobacter humi TaxID=1411620 RepID=A0ABW2UEG3_9BACT
MEHHWLGSGHLEIEYYPGPRRLADLQNLLGHAKQRLIVTGWNKLLGDQRHMAPFTAEEQHWVTALWLNVSQPRPGNLFGAAVLAPDVFAELPVPAQTAEAQVLAMRYRLFNDLTLARWWLRELRLRK